MRPYPYSQKVNPSMNISTLDIATLASAFGTQAVARVKDDTARTLARTLIATRRDDAKRQALADAEAALEAAQAARQAAVTQAELAAMQVVADLNRQHAPAINAAFAAREAAKQAVSAAAAPVKAQKAKP